MTEQGEKFMKITKEVLRKEVGFWLCSLYIITMLSFFGGFTQVIYDLNSTPLYLKIFVFGIFLLLLVHTKEELLYPKEQNEIKR